MGTGVGDCLSTMSPGLGSTPEHNEFPRRLGVGTAMVYPTLLASIGDVAHPGWRASSVGVYRLWRDLGYAVGALLAGVTADALDLAAAMWLIGALTLVSGVVVACRMSETLRRAAIPAPSGDEKVRRVFP